MYDDLPAAGAAGAGTLAMTGMHDLETMLGVALALIAAGAATLASKTLRARRAR